VMYLSRVRVPWRHARDAYALHKALWRLFPDQPPESRRQGTEERQGFLFRVERHQVGGEAQVLLQSRHSPQTGADGVYLEGPTKMLVPRFEIGQLLRFRLLANPVKTIADEQGRHNGKGQVKKNRVPLIREAEQAAWLLRHLQPAVELALETVVCQPQLPLYFRKGEHRGKIKPVLFDGFLSVHEPAAMQALICNGIGPAKGLGCGLLSVAGVRAA
jgi:CRISPR system Cascade subunit CasE